ncbi:tyrosine-protein phosphatase [Pseudomonas extremaustralis]|uniref:tyrosine-protein phosphatase n=1 Tax=Pseudomonas extremaustralis TaxID=359110 RepID=UPI0028561327|nr:tyrosine-protein phosphatase [Pseudomonas extremaustralis]MDR6575930.1 protein-tyrosine phosphatase [Pseudomonas extremaustralis]
MTASSSPPYLSSVPNFRDMGGLRTSNGRSLRHGLVYRSQDFSTISDADLQHLQDLNAQLLCDIRSDSERQQHPNRWPIDGTSTFNLNISADLRANHQAITRLLSGTPGKAQAEQAMLATYRIFPQAFELRLAQMFERILGGGQLPLIFHCAAGKDRTGFIAAVLLCALGVPKNIIYADYLLSGERWKGEHSEAAIRRYLAPLCDQAPSTEVIRILSQVDSRYLDAAFEVIEQNYGGMEAYLIVIGLDQLAREQLCTLLLN